MEILLNERQDFLSTPNQNAVTYALMVEDERQYRIAEAKAKANTLAHNPDAEMIARWNALGRDFVGEMRRIRLVW